MQSGSSLLPAHPEGVAACFAASLVHREHDTHFLKADQVLVRPRTTPVRSHQVRLWIANNFNEITFHLVSQLLEEIVGEEK
jgi:hypothetical protein